MNSYTKKILLLSVVLLLVALGSGLFLSLQIHSEGKLLGTYITALQERGVREAAYIRVNRLVQETEMERATLAAAFFADEGDSISFLGNLEAFADDIGLTLKTEGLDKVTGTGTETEYITMTFVYTGNRDQVLAFTKLLEEIPYHSTVDALYLRKLHLNEWEGKLKLNITLLPS